MFDAVRPSFNDAIEALADLHDAVKHPSGTGPVWRDAMLGEMEVVYRELAGATEILGLWLTVRGVAKPEFELPAARELDRLVGTERRLGVDATIQKQVQTVLRLTVSASDALRGLWSTVQRARSSEERAATDSLGLATYALLNEQIIQLTVCKLVMEDPRGM